LRHWKADEQLRRVPFIVYTATYTEPKDEKLALDLGADAFILKPAEPEPFLARVQEVLRQAQAGALTPPQAPAVEEPEQLREYSEVLIHKLEEKTRQLEQTNAELTAISEIITATAAQLDLQTIFDRALRGAIELTEMEGGTLCLVDDSTRTLRLAAHVNTSPETVRDLTANDIRIGDCLCGHCAHTSQPLILWDNASGSAFATREATRNEGIRFHAAFPLLVQARCIGVLCIFAKSEKKPTPRSLDVVQKLCGPIALAMQNARLFEAANRELAERKRAEEALRTSEETLRQSEGKGWASRTRMA
jgi:transcriptional regulator with GAF, ATPase, and Fis domain